VSSHRSHVYAREQSLHRRQCLLRLLSRAVAPLRAAQAGRLDSPGNVPGQETQNVHQRKLALTRIEAFAHRFRDHHFGGDLEQAIIDLDVADAGGIDGAQFGDTATRGLALTIATCMPALLGAAGAPLLSDFVDANGWRSGYRALAVFLLLLGGVSVLLIAPGRRDENTAAQRAGGEHRRTGAAVFKQIGSNKTFWLIAVAMFLCTLQTPLHSSQLNLMLLDNHISTATAARVVSVYAIGTVIGRLACGLALDRFAPYLVASSSMALPAIGYAILASTFDSVPAIGLAMFMVGLAVGAEADLASYLVARYFKLDIYSTVASLIYSAVFLASATGALTLSLVLRITNSFSMFLWFVSLAILCGGLLFLRLRHVSPATLQPTDEDPPIAASKPFPHSRPSFIR
jgi:MFS family permease